MIYIVGVNPKSAWRLGGITPLEDRMLFCQTIGHVIALAGSTRLRVRCVPEEFQEVARVDDFGYSYLARILVERV